MDRITVLFVAANPMATARLQLDEEIHAIQEKINAAALRDHVELKFLFAARPDEIQVALNQYRPQILHFSGHGYPGGELILVDPGGNLAPVSVEAIQGLISATPDNLRLVVFNACATDAHAQAVAEVVGCAIGMMAEINDQAAITFAAALYNAIASGRSVREAFAQARAALPMKQHAEQERILLHEKPGSGAGKLVFFADHEAARLPGLPYTPQNEQDFLAGIDLSTVKRLSVLSHTGRRIYDAVHQQLERLIRQRKDFPEEVRILTRAPVLEGLYRNNYIRNTLAKVKTLGLQQKNIDVRLYETVPAFRGILCEFHDHRRLTYLSTYAWQTPNTSKASEYGFVVADSAAQPHPLVAMLETWIEQYWGKDEIHTLVFDFDDTLVFSGEVQVKAWALAIEAALKRELIQTAQLASTLRYDPAQPAAENQDLLKDIQEVFVDRQMADQILPALIPGMKDPAVLEEINRMRYRLREEMMGQVRVFNGVEEMLRRLGEHYHFAIISSTDEQMIYDYLSQKGLLKYFSLVMGKNDPGLQVEHEHIHNKASLLIKLSQIIGIPLSRLVYIGDNQTDYLATRQIGIPFIEARQAARLVSRKSFIKPDDPSRPTPPFFDSYENDRLPEILRAHSRELSRRKYQM